MEVIVKNLSERVSKAVSIYWATRENQAKKQEGSGRGDQGLRSAVTGGAQMDGFIGLLTEAIIEGGIDDKHVFHNKNLELPGFFQTHKRMGSPCNSR